MKQEVVQERPNKYRRRLRLVPTKAQFRSALTNGRLLDKAIDARSAFMRRLRDLTYQHEADLGGNDILSEGQRAIVRRVAMLEIQLENLEHKFAENDGVASRYDLDCYQRASNSLRRLLESLGLHRGRIPRNVNTSLGDILRNGHRQAEVQP
jgi:hypothetical protein